MLAARRKRIMNKKMKHTAGLLCLLVLMGCQFSPRLSGEQIPEGTTPVINGIATPQNQTDIDRSTPSPGTKTKDAPTFTVSAPLRDNESPTPTMEVILSATTTPSGTPISATRFAVIGDYGLAGDPERDVADLVKRWNPDFIITTGDNNYPEGEPETIDKNIGQYYHAFISPYTGIYGEGADVNRFFPTLGNHDWNTSSGASYLDYFTLPGNERYYDFVWGHVHLFAIDSDSREPDGVGRSSIQGQWLRDKLAASESVWKIVYMHHPPYTSSGEEGSIDWIQWPFKEWGATAVISGNSHVYERLSVDGFPYFVNGLGGGPRYDFNDTLPASQVRFRGDYGAMFIEATEQRISFQFITRNHEIIDSFEIINNN
jgi:tartrate-resistant acid phosphatase type 5